MIIIIEGPDGSGKTTLAKKLAKTTGYILLHRTKPETEEDKAAMLNEYIQVLKEGKNVIFDRAWYSEMVYGKIMRDESVIDYPSMYRLEELANNNGALLIYCMDSHSALWKRCLERGEAYITEKLVHRQICEEYEILMQVPHIIPVVRYGYKDV